MKLADDFLQVYSFYRGPHGVSDSFRPRLQFRHVILGQEDVLLVGGPMFQNGVERDRLLIYVSDCDQMVADLPAWTRNRSRENFIAVRAVKVHGCDGLVIAS